MKSRLAPDNEKLWKKTLQDTPKFLAGKPSSYRKIELPVAATSKDVKAARKAIHATQRRFAGVVGVSGETVKAWEAGRRVPEGPASKAIRLIRTNAEFAELFEAA
jgi:DNA-binding transcriptional regulator YiaG